LGSGIRIRDEPFSGSGKNYLFAIKSCSGNHKEQKKR
jgi:hypothetical protein